MLDRHALHRGLTHFRCPSLLLPWSEIRELVLQIDFSARKYVAIGRTSIFFQPVWANHRHDHTECNHGNRLHLGIDGRSSRVAMFTNSARELAFILRITRPRCAFTVSSEMPSSPPACLFKRPPTTNAMT